MEVDDDDDVREAFSSSINSRRHCSAISAASNFSSPVNEVTTPVDRGDSSVIVTFNCFVDVEIAEFVFFIDDLVCTTDSLDQDEISRANSCRWPGVMVPNESEPSGRMFRDKWYSVSWRNSSTDRST